MNRLFLVFAASLALAASASAQNLVVATNTLETGVQSYTFGEITNGATYTLSGPSAVLGVAGNFYVGTTTVAGVQNGNLVLTNGAVFSQTNGTFGFMADSGRRSSILISGAAFTNAAYLSGGSSQGALSLIINNGSKVLLNGLDIDATNSYFEISGGAKVFSARQIRLGLGNSSKEFVEAVLKGQGTQLFITNGGGVGSGKLVLGGLGSARLTMSDGALSTNANGLSVGAANSAGYAMGSMTGWLSMSSGAVITNGQASSGPTIIFGGYNNNNGPGIGIALLTDPGTILTTMAGQNASIGVYGSNATYRSQVVVSNGAFLGNLGTANIEVRAGTLLAVDGGIIHTDYGFRTDTTGAGASIAGFSNIGGVFQFGGWNPVIATNGGAIVVQNGTISFRGIGNASVTADISGNGLTNLTYLGTNSFQLNNASNTSVAFYNFSASYGPTNWAALRLTGATSAWRSTTFRVDSSGTLLVTNTFARVVGTFTNDGAVRVMNSKVSYANAVAPSGSLYGSNGDLFVFNKNFINASTNAASFNLSHAAVLFTNSATHLLSVSNSGSLNLGQGFQSFAEVASNFAIGQLSIASGNRVTIAGNKDSLTNALYVGWLDIQGINTNSYGNVTNGLFLALNLPSINVYYDKYDARNDWLNANLINDSVAGYNLWGGGLLLPIPEPSAFATIAAGLGLLVYLRGRRKA